MSIYHGALNLRRVTGKWMDGFNVLEEEREVTAEHKETMFFEKYMFYNHTIYMYINSLKIILINETIWWEVQ